MIEKSRKFEKIVPDHPCWERDYEDDRLR